MQPSIAMRILPDLKYKAPEKLNRSLFDTSSVRQVEVCRAKKKYASQKDLLRYSDLRLVKAAWPKAGENTPNQVKRSCDKYLD